MGTWLRGWLVLAACMLSAADVAVAQAGPGGVRAGGSIQLSAAVRTAAMQVVPVALTRFALVSAAGDSLVIATGRDGNGSMTAPAGDYTAVSLEPVQVDGSRYQWAVPIHVDSGAVTHLDLSNLNAQVSEARGPGQRARASGSPEAELFHRFGASVVRVEAGLGHGSGFIADTLDGVIITNAHVIGAAGDQDVAVILDSLTRVRAQILARDNNADVAVLRIAPRFLQGRQRMPLGEAGDGAVMPGDRLVALGYPLHQGLTMTTGIASGIREGAIISDVNINPGNSGGPLLTLDGEVIALNTFGDQDSHGPGVSGSILVTRAGPVLLKAAAARDTLGQPSDTLLPVRPRVTMSASALRTAAEAVKYQEYVRYSLLEVNGRFDVSLQTPLATFVDMAHYEKEVGKDRRKREAQAGLTQDERFGEMKQYRDWVDYVGDITIPVVSLVVQPKIGETGGSVFGRVLAAALVGARTRATYKFKGDVRGVRLFVGDSAREVVPLRGGHAPQSVWEEGQWVQLKDVADLGYYVYDPEAFRPSRGGTPPVMVIAVEDLKVAGHWSCKVLPEEAVARVWNGFEDYYREYRSDQVFNLADRKAEVETGPARATLRDRCDF